MQFTEKFFIFFFKIITNKILCVKFKATQLSQSAHMSLQLPYTVFGLGATPNFVEELSVGFLLVDQGNNIKGISRKWQQIIPNSQLVINPWQRYFPFQ